jgi:hypothetical protein
MSCPYTSPQNGKAGHVIHSINNIICTLLIQSSVPPIFGMRLLALQPISSTYYPPKHLHSLHHTLLSSATTHPMSTFVFLAANATPIFLPPLHINYLLAQPLMSSLAILPTTKATYALIANPIVPSFPVMCFLMKPHFPFPRIPIHPHQRPSTSSMITLTRLQLLLDFRLCLLFRYSYGATPPPPVASSPVVPPAASEATLQPPAVLAGPIAPSSGLVPPSAPMIQSPDWMVGIPGASSPATLPPGSPAVPDVHGTTAPADRFCGRVYSSRPPTTTAPAPPPTTATTPLIPIGAVPVDPVVNHHRMTTRGKSGLRFPALFEASALCPILRTYRAAHTDPNWRSAMEQEYSALIGNHTWDLLPRPPHCNVVTGKWVFKHKFKGDGSLERYKGRWVLRGFTQRPSIDFKKLLV